MELGYQGLEQLLSEAMKPKMDRTGAWVSGTMGLDSTDNTITLEVQVMVPKPEHDELEREFSNDGWGSPESEIKPFTDVDEFIDRSLRADATGRDLREWCRTYSVHNSPLADGLCPNMDETDFDVWVGKWRELDYSREGTWLGGSVRHMVHQPDCPWCVSRFKKGVATGSPNIPAPPLTPEYVKRLLRDGKNRGRACGDPVRPLRFTTREIGREEAIMDVRGNKRSKLWFTRQRKTLAKSIMYKYENLVLEAIKKRLNVPKDSDLYDLIFGPELNDHDPWPSNFEYKIIDASHVRANYGRVPELQGLQFSSYSQDAPGHTYKERLKTRDGYVRRSKSYVDLSGLEMHFVYNYIVEIDLSGSTGPDSFMQILTTKIRKAIKEGPEFHSYWVDSGGNAFTIERYQTGLNGLNFLIDPFMPQKGDKSDKSLIPAFSPAWYMGGRADRVAIDTLVDWIDENFDITLAPFDQYNDFPIGSDGSIYTVKENSVFVLKNGEHIAGEVSESESNDKEIVIRKLHLSDEGDKQDVSYETPFNIKTRRITPEKVSIPINMIRDKVVLQFDEYDFDDLAVDYSSPEKLKQYFEKMKSDLAKLLPPDEYLDKLEKEKGDKFTDTYGIINPEAPGTEYSWRDPVLWSRELLKSLMTPLPITDEHGKMFMVRNGDKFEYVSPGATFTWNVLEDPGHPEHPYVSESNKIIPAIHSNRLRSILEGRGDYYNQTTQQWEGQHRVNFYNSDGVMKYKWIPYNESAFWAHVPGLKFPEYIASLRRTSAWAQSLSKEAEIARLKGEVKNWVNQSFEPTKQVMGKEVGAKRKTRSGGKTKETKLRSEPFEMVYWSTEWFQANMKRVKSGMFPSPTHWVNPPKEFWEDVNPKPPGWDNRLGKRKDIWPCRKCDGDGCKRCLETIYAKEYPPPANVNPDNPIKVWVRNKKEFITRDIWSGSEWIAYLKAVWATFKHKLKEVGKEKDLSERKHRIRNKFNNLFKSYDYHCLMDKIKREPDQPIDLSNLSELDKTMLVVNFGGDAPRMIDDNERDKFITGMVAVNTELFHNVLPPDLKEWYLNNTVDGGRARPDVLMDRVSELRDFEEDADKIIQSTPEIRAELEKEIEEDQLESLNDSQTSNIDEMKHKEKKAEDWQDLSADEIQEIMKPYSSENEPLSHSKTEVDDRSPGYDDIDDIDYARDQADDHEQSDMTADDVEDDLSKFDHYEDPAPETMPSDPEFQLTDNERENDSDDWDDDDDWDEEGGYLPTSDF